LPNNRLQSLITTLDEPEYHLLFSLSISSPSVHIHVNHDVLDGRGRRFKRIETHQKTAKERRYTRPSRIIGFHMEGREYSKLNEEQ
jgi:hypothetical protein